MEDVVLGEARRGDDDDIHALEHVAGSRHREEPPLLLDFLLRQRPRQREGRAVVGRPHDGKVAVPGEMLQQRRERLRLHGKVRRVDVEPLARVEPGHVVGRRRPRPAKRRVRRALVELELLPGARAGHRRQARAARLARVVGSQRHDSILLSLPLLWREGVLLGGRPLRLLQHLVLRLEDEIVRKVVVEDGRIVGAELGVLTATFRVLGEARAADDEARECLDDGADPVPFVLCRGGRRRREAAVSNVLGRLPRVSLARGIPEVAIGDFLERIVDIFQRRTHAEAVAERRRARARSRLSEMGADTARVRHPHVLTGVKVILIGGVVVPNRADVDAVVGKVFHRHEAGRDDRRPNELSLDDGKRPAVSEHRVQQHVGRRQDLALMGLRHVRKVEAVGTVA